MFSYLSRADFNGYNVSESPNPTQAAWDIVGIYSKIEDYQMGNTGFFPTSYNHTLSSHVNSVYGQLDRFMWYKGIQYTIVWGDIETTKWTSSAQAQADPNWAPIDKLMNTIRDLYTNSNRLSAQNKKVLFMLPLKVFSLTKLDQILPPYLSTSSGNYPAPNNAAVRYDRAIGFKSGNSVNGYHIRTQDFINGLTGLDKNGDPIYTLRDRYLNFLTELNIRYKDHPAFGGILNTEPPPVFEAAMYDGTEFDRNLYFAGRLQILKFMKQIFTKHIVADDCNFDSGWVDDMTGQNAPDGCAVNGIGFNNSDFHLGTNLAAIYNAADYLTNVVTVINNCQPLEQDSVNGFFKKPGTLPNEVYTFNPVPPNYGNPRTQIENSNVDSTGNVLIFDPPNYKWVIHRSIYLKSNILIYQHNYANVGGKSAPRYNWVKFYTDMNNNTTLMSPNTGGLIQNDPTGGMNTTRPLRVAGD